MKTELTEGQFKEIFNAHMKMPDGTERTVGERLLSLMSKCWKEGESFSGKRPFGWDEWQMDFCAPLITLGLINGNIDEDNEIEWIDWEEGEKIIAALIEWMQQKVIMSATSRKGNQ